MDEEEFSRELEKRAFQAEGTACATIAGQRGPGVSSAIPAALGGLEQRGQL